MNVDVRGKTVLVLINDPDFETSGIETGQGDFGGKAMTYYGRWTYKYEEAARRGAKGLLVIHETAPASYGWATVKNSNTNTMFDIVRQDPPASHTGFESWIQRPLAEQIFAASGLNFDQARAAARLRRSLVRSSSCLRSSRSPPRSRSSSASSRCVSGFSRPDVE